MPSADDYGADRDKQDIDVGAIIVNECALIKEYTNLNQFEILNLPLDMYKLNLKESFIHKHSQTKEGREYLKKAHRLKQTGADLNKIRSMKGYKAQ